MKIINRFKEKVHHQILFNIILISTELINQNIATLYPNKNNIINDQELPIPIEIAYVLEDSEPDNTKLNRYYFNFPADWIASNHGESIIGVRKIFMMPRRRKLKFTISTHTQLKSAPLCFAPFYKEFGPL